MSYPSNLIPFLKRLQAHSVNTFRMEPSGSRTASAGQVVSFQLPSNALVDLGSIKYMFNAQTTGDNARLPNKISSLIERYSVECGGVVVYQGHLGYNVVKHAKDALEMPSCKEVSRMVQAHEFIPRQKKIEGGTDYTDTTPEAPSSANDRVQFCVDDWLGFFEAKPQILDTSLLPEITIKLFLAPNSVVTKSGNIDTPANFISDGSGSATYTINNQRMLVSCYSLNDGFFDQMMEQRIADKGFIEVPFKQYFTYFDGAHSGQTRFSVGTQSLDKVYACWRNNTYNTQGAPVLVSGYNSLENSEHKGEKYISKFFNFPKPSGITGAQFNLNGTLYPQFMANSDEWFQLSCEASKKMSKEIHSLPAWENNYHIYGIRLNNPESDNDLRMVSGLDTRSMNLSGYLTSQGVTGNPAVAIICEATSTLRIGAGMNISVIV